jgi:hypothetical protein
MYGHCRAIMLVDISGWMESMEVDKAVLPYRLDTATHAAFLSSLLTGTVGLDTPTNSAFLY